jgi:hypothetical protein
MKIPEIFFIIINPCMRLLLRSPLHFILSGNVMLIAFTGKKSGRKLETPVRYVREGDRVICFTGKANKWWHNFKESADVKLTVKGKVVNAQAQAYYDGGMKTRQELERFLARFPQDAIYHDIHWGKDGKLVEAELVQALPHVVMVMFEVV